MYLYDTCKCEWAYINLLCKLVMSTTPSPSHTYIHTTACLKKGNDESDNGYISTIELNVLRYQLVHTIHVNLMNFS